MELGGREPLPRYSVLRVEPTWPPPGGAGGRVRVRRDEYSAAGRARLLLWSASRSAAMSYLLPHLTSGWAVDQAILSEENRLIVLRFGHDYDPTCMQMDEVCRVQCPVPVARRPTSSLVVTAGAVLNRGAREELLDHLSRGHDRGSRFQHDVRAVRPVHRHVLLPQQGVRLAVAAPASPRPLARAVRRCAVVS